MINWPGFAFLAMSGASMTIFVTVGFSATFSVILYIAFAPYSYILPCMKTRLFLGAAARSGRRESSATI